MSNPGKKSHLKKFTYAQIDKKVNDRSDVPQYYQLLMDSAVSKDDAGVVFDTTHPSWKLLVKVVKRVTSSTGNANSPSKKEAKSSEKETKKVEPVAKPEIPVYQKVESINPGDQDLLRQIEQELKGETPDKHLIRHSCKICGIPDALRAPIWKVLLGVSFLGETKESSTTIAFDMHNQRVVKADIERTLSHMDVFRSSKVRADMELILTRYCKTHKVSYKQGMNYILAPFFLIDLPNKEDIYYCYESFIGTFLCNTLSDDDFGGLQCLFALFRLLLLYHDPELSNYLDQYDMGPELYASSWFITLYSNRVPMDILFHLWDGLILDMEEDNLLHYFVSLALLISHRDLIMSENVVSLPQMLSSIRINSKQEVTGLISKAKLLYRSQTPQSVLHRIQSLSKCKINLDSWEMKQMMASPCVSVSADEIVKHCYEMTGKSNPLQFYILDCRPRRHFSAGHLPCAHHIDPDLLSKPQKLQAELSKLQAMKGYHFCFISEGGESQAKGRASGAMMNLHFLQMGVKYVSVVEGGYHNCHKLILAPNNNFSLIDHNHKLCLECNPRSKSNTGILSAFKRRVKGLLSDVAAPTKENAPSKLSEDFKALNIPDNTLELSHTNEVALLHTMLRDRNTTGHRLFRCVDRLSALVVGEAFDALELREKEVTTPSGCLYTGVEGLVHVCGIALSEIDGIVLKRALEPFSYISHIELGEIQFLRSPHHRSETPKSVSSPRSPRSPSPFKNTLKEGGISVSVFLPDDISTRSVYVFAIVLQPENESEVMAALSELTRRGVVRITIVCIIAARSVIWNISERYEHVLVSTASVDEYRNNCLVPGVGDIEERMGEHIRSMTQVEKQAVIPFSRNGQTNRRKYRTLG